MSERLEKLNSLVQREVAEILRRELEFDRDTMVTVARAAVATDAESAKVWISVLPSDAGEAALAKINGHIGQIQSLLNRRLVMKFVPKLTFFLDHQQTKAEHVSQVLDQLTDEDLGN